jgi:predicted RNase H-like HicB family nuclease
VTGSLAATSGAGSDRYEHLSRSASVGGRLVETGLPGPAAPRLSHQIDGPGSGRWQAGILKARAASSREQPMLQAYIRGALGRAHYEILEDDGSYYGEIPDFDGVFANAETLEKCREELEEVLEEWVLFRVSRNLPLPTVDGIELQVRKVG